MADPTDRGGVRVVAYDPDWPAAFRREAASVATALGDLAEEIEHFGSTAVPGMAAKPIIDILVGWQPPGDIQRARDLLAPLGYDYIGEDGRRPGRLMFSKRTGQWCNLSIVPTGGRLWSDNLAVRDYLRAHRAAAQRYEEVKSQAATEHTDPQAYQDAKRDFVDRLRRAAHQWAQEHLHG